MDLPKLDIVGDTMVTAVTTTFFETIGGLPNTPQIILDSL
jgi:hypothetical protein